MSLIKISVLDHGFVALDNSMGTDADIARIARISTKKESTGKEHDQKLLRYLLKNKHTSPFEMCKITFHVKLPIFVMRQWVRHRMQNLNEVSARYTELPNEFYIPSEWRRQAPKNKQASVVETGFNPMFDTPLGEAGFTARDAVHDHCRDSYELYEKLLASGIAREMARMVLPVNIYTEIFSCWDLNNLLKFFALRDDAHAQAEIQEYARAMKQIATQLFPWTMEVYEELRLDADWLNEMRGIPNERRNLVRDYLSTIPT